jgi:hypothetical protein
VIKRCQSPSFVAPCKSASAENIDFSYSTLQLRLIWPFETKVAIGTSVRTYSYYPYVTNDTSHKSRPISPDCPVICLWRHTFCSLSSKWIISNSKPQVLTTQPCSRKKAFPPSLDLTSNTNVLSSLICRYHPPLMKAMTYYIFQSVFDDVRIVPTRDPLDSSDSRMSAFEHFP